MSSPASEVSGTEPSKEEEESKKGGDPRPTETTEVTLNPENWQELLEGDGNQELSEVESDVEEEQSSKDLLPEISSERSPQDTLPDQLETREYRRSKREKKPPDRWKYK